jgi:hypothetical protein
MSAYICSPEHIGILAAFAAFAASGSQIRNSVIYEWRRGSRSEDARCVAEHLAKANIRSVSGRYPDDRDGQRPGPGLYDAEVIEASRLWAEHYSYNMPAIPPLHIYNLANGFAYQACETDDWPVTLAARQIDWIKDKAVRRMPGAEDAPWGYDVPDDQMPAKLKKFYESIGERA